MKKLLITIFASSLTVAAYSQQWIKTYCDTGGFSGMFAVETYDKGFLVGGSAFSGKENAVLYKTDINGNILWQRSIKTSGYNTNVNAICTTPDGGCAIVGSISNLKDETFLLKLNACGQMEWSKRYSADGISVTPSNIYKMKDGGFVFNLEENTNNQDVYYCNQTTCAGWVYRTDKSGNLIWELPQNSLPLNISVDDSDNIIISGYYFYQLYDMMTSIPETIMYVSKLDSNGKLLINGSNEDFRNSGQQTLSVPGGNFLTYAGDLGSNVTWELFLFLWDNKGKLLYDKEISDAVNVNIPADMISTNDSAYIMLAAQLSEYSTICNMRVLKIRQDTIKTIDTVYKFGVQMYPTTIRATSDGKYIISGSVTSYNGSNHGIYMVKINSNLEPDSFYQTKYNYDYLCGSMQDTGTILLDNSLLKDLAIDETIKPEDGFFIYPNPARDFSGLRCSGLTDDAVQLSLYNMFGVNLMSSNFRADGNGNLNQQIELQNIPAGCYAVELVQRDKRLIQKLMIEK